MPSPKSLARYGLVPEDWEQILERQGHRCPICLRPDTEVELVVDHEHAAGWKRMPKTERRRYVRGAICRHDNMRFLPERLTSVLSARVSAYLREHEVRFAGVAANDVDPAAPGRVGPCGPGCGCVDE